jgi:tRNA G37 N-methylase Trm5
MYAFEVDPDSCATAKQNVKHNKLTEKIQVIQQNVENDIFSAVMQKLLESMTSTFPPAQTAEYTKAGWCYMNGMVHGLC